jgi:copper chaperone NosL
VDYAEEKVLMRRLGFTVLFLGSLFFGVASCSKPDQAANAIQQVVAIESGDECHLCGMIIDNFPGPKGQLYQRSQSEVKKFCSTRDMFAYLLDPERTHNIQSAFVHDMAVTPWDHPKEDVYIDARLAWYVIGHNRKGAMGPTLASFAKETHAKVFSDQYGGKLYRFDQLNLQLITGMGF